jgi:hypothetical protein
MEMIGVNVQDEPTIQALCDMLGDSHKTQLWYSEYMGTLFESDRKLIGTRIQHAKLLILKRERELFADGTSSAEQRALNNALHALEALRVCLGL